MVIMKSVQLDSFIEIMESGNDKLIESFILISDEGYDLKSKRGMTYDELQTLYTLLKQIIDGLSFSQKEGYVSSYSRSTYHTNIFGTLFLYAFSLPRYACLLSLMG